MAQGYTREFIAIPSLKIVGSAGNEVNLSAGNRTSGTTLATSGVANTKGAYTTILTPASDVYGMYLRVQNCNSTGTNRDALMDIAYGASDTVVVPNLNIGEAGPKEFNIYGLNIPSGEAIKARMQCTAGAQAANVSIMSVTRARLAIPLSTYIAYGVDTANSRGTSVSAGAGAFGSWVEIGTTSRDHYVWLPGFDIFGAISVLANDILVEIATGPNSGSLTTMGFATCSHSSVEIVTTYSMPIFYATSSGAKVWARAASGTAVAIGVSLHGN
jgi:hypothetical protein